MSVGELPGVMVGPTPGRTTRFGWRGLLIDSARTCYPVPVLLRVIELAARYGFNRLHWHLSDDQGWRFEVPQYPRLTEIGAVLPRGRFDDYDSLLDGTRGRALAEAPAKWTNGFYSDAEIRTVVEHASAHGIEIIPEVDLPGHMAAAIKAYPELGRPEGLPLPGGSMRDHMWWPARNDLLWPTPEAQDFVRAVMKRVTELFPGRHVHIGGDECAYRQWSSDPDILSLLEGRGVGSVEELQVWFMDTAAAALRTEGRSIAAWDEACEIWDDDSVLVVAWDEERGMERVTRSRHQYVFADARTLYLNRVDPDGLPTQKGMTPGIAVRDILTAPWEETLDERCIGIQACVWSEFVLDGADLLSMLLPRLLAVAERIWEPEINIADATGRIHREYELLVEAGVLDEPF